MKTPLIVANGALPPKSFFDNFQSTHIIALDGAALQLALLGVNPSIILGDFDALSTNSENKTESFFQSQFPESCLQKIQCQNTTDFEKLLKEIDPSKLKNGTIVGLFGKDIDHTLNNFRLFGDYGYSRSLRFYHQDDMQVPQWGYCIQGAYTIKQPKNSLISIFANKTSQITTRGLKWELTDTILQSNGTSSVRNQSAREEVHIQVKKGCAICIIRAHEPPVVTKHTGSIT